MRDRLAESVRSVRVLRQREARVLERCADVEKEHAIIQAKLDETQVETRVHSRNVHPFNACGETSSAGIISCGLEIIRAKLLDGTIVVLRDVIEPDCRLTYSIPTRLSGCSGERTAGGVVATFHPYVACQSKEDTDTGEKACAGHHAGLNLRASVEVEDVLIQGRLLMSK